MDLAWLLALQTTATAAPPMLSPIDFDLATVKPADDAGGGCVASDGVTIVVCGRRAPRDRFTAEEMEALARLYADKPVRAEMGLGDRAQAGLSFSPTQLPGGVVSNRILVGVKLPF